MNRTIFTYCICAVIFWAAHLVLNKHITGPGPKYLALYPAWANFFIGLGILLAAVVHIAISREPFQASPQNIIVPSANGLIWYFGTLFCLLAYAQGADTAKITPIVALVSPAAIIGGAIIYSEAKTSYELFKFVTGGFGIVGIIYWITKPG